ncbi:hypothetical protein FXO38_22198 [Capsicum annuum]|nr:hypothetical protein FXO38_22198 [Capsicum annuum]
MPFHLSFAICLTASDYHRSVEVASPLSRMYPENLQIVTKFKGHKEMKVDKDLVTVTGSMDMKALAEMLKKHLKKEVELVPPKKEGGEKKEKGADNGKGGGKGKGKDGEGNGEGKGKVKDDVDDVFIRNHFSNICNNLRSIV